MSQAEQAKPLDQVLALITGRQPRRTIRYESVLIALVGAALGVAVGLAGAASLVHLLRKKGLTDLSVPPVQLAGYVAAAVVAGVLAAAWPARRATRMDILGAISAE